MTTSFWTINEKGNQIAEETLNVANSRRSLITDACGATEYYTDSFTGRTYSESCGRMTAEQAEAGAMKLFAMSISQFRNEDASDLLNSYALRLGILAKIAREEGGLIAYG